MSLNGKDLLEGAIDALLNDKLLRNKFDRVTGSETYEQYEGKRGFIFIKSVDRDNYPLGSPTDFTISLKAGSIIRNPKYLKLESLTMARTFYNFYPSTICFSEDGDDTVVFESPSFTGFISTFSQLITQIENCMNAAVAVLYPVGPVPTIANTYTAAYDATTGKITVTGDAVTFKFWWNVYNPAYNYLVDAPTADSTNFKIGYNDFMYFGGFTVSQFTPSASYSMTQVSTGVANLTAGYGLNMVLRGLESHYVNTSNFTTSYFIPITDFSLNSAITYLSNNTFDNVIDLTYNTGFQLSTLSIQIFDDLGAQLNLQGSEWEAILSYELWEERL